MGNDLPNANRTSIVWIGKGREYGECENLCSDLILPFEIQHLRFEVWYSIFGVV